MIRPVAAAPGVQEAGMGMFTDVRLLVGPDDSVYTEFVPTPPNAAAAQSLLESSCQELQVGYVGMTTVAVFAPGLAVDYRGDTRPTRDNISFSSAPATCMNA